MSDGAEANESPPAPPDVSHAKRSILSNALSSYVRLGLEALVFIILTPFMVEHLGTKKFGLWSLLWAVMGLLSLLDLGFGPAVTKFVADARGKQDPVAHQKAVATLFWTYVALGFVMEALVVICALNPIAIIGVAPEYAESTKWAILVLGTGAAIDLPLCMFRGVFLGHQRQRYINFYEILAIFLYFGLVFVFLRWYPDVEWLAIMQAGTTLLGHLALTIHAQLTIPNVSLHPRHFDRKLMPSLLSFSVFFMLVSISGFIATRVDALIVNWAFEDESSLYKVAVYSVAIRLVGRAAQVGVQLSETLTPVVAEMHGAGAEDELRRVWLRASKMGVAIAAPLMVGLAVLSEPLIRTWIDEFSENEVLEAARTTQILIVAGSTVVVHAISHNMLSMRGKQLQLALSVLVGQLLNLGLSFALAIPHGLFGIATATLISALIENVGLIIGQVGKQQKTSRWTFYRTVLLPSVIPVTVMALAMWGLQQVYGLTYLVEVAAVEVLGIALFWALYWKVGFGEDERRFVKEKVMRRLRRR